jgi:hypothetical protein
VQVASQKGGTTAQVAPEDGPQRLVQIKPASEGVIIWQQMEGKKQKKPRTYISLLRPRPLAEFGFPRVHPRIAQGATVLGQLHRHQIIWLGAEPDRPAGFYRVTKCQENGVTVQPEEVVPAEIARRMGVKLESAEDSAAAPEDTEKIKYTLGKHALVEYFDRKKRCDASGAGKDAQS